VYAIDIHVLTMKLVQWAADKWDFNNIWTVLGASLVDVPEGRVCG
jgi:hypothetical protein